MYVSSSFLASSPVAMGPLPGAPCSADKPAVATVPGTAVSLSVAVSLPVPRLRALMSEIQEAVPV